MKWILGILLIGATALVALGLPGSEEARREARFGADTPLLPFTFGHDDHFTVPCATCHHEFVDDTGGGPPCMTCHVTDARVSPLLEQQFHDLCRSCHMAEDIVGKPSGPTRRCVACHLPDDRF